MEPSWRHAAALVVFALAARCLQLPDTVEPRAYRLQLLLNTAKATYSGRVTVNVTCRQETDHVVMHADPAVEIGASRVSVAHPSSRTAWSQPVSVLDVQRQEDQQLLVLVLSRRLRRHGGYSVSLDFQGRLGSEGELGLVRAAYLDRDTNNTEWYVVTNMSLGGARKLFPCFDEPFYKATFEISVGTPSHQHVFSNMPLADIENVEGQPGWYWKHFSATPRMSTFSIGMVVLEYEHFSLAEGSFHIVGPTSVENKIETTVNYLQDVYEYLQDYLDYPYPMLKLDVVLVPGVHREVPASWGLIVLGESSIADVDRWRLARELATQWVGHLATPRGSREWQSGDGFVMHLGYQFLDQCNYASVMDTARLHYGYEQVSFTRADNLGADRRRDKVFWLLRMLQHGLTKRTFRAGFHMFLKSRQYKTFSEDELWATLTSQARVDRTLPQDVSVQDVAGSWLDQDLIPVLEVTRNYDRRTFTLAQHAFRVKGTQSATDGDDPLWHIPVTYLTTDDTNISMAETRHWMKKQRAMTIGEDLCPAKFLIVNPADVGGLMLVNYDATNWALLAHALQRKMLPTAVRAKLLHDAWNLAFAGELNFNSAMNMTLFLKDEAEYEVWDVMYAMLDHVGRFLDGTRAGHKFKRYVSELALSSGALPRLLRDCKRPGRYVSAQPENCPEEIEEHDLKIDGDESCSTLTVVDLVEFHRALKKISMRLTSNKSNFKYHKHIVNCFSKFINDPEKIHRFLEAVMLEDRSLFTDDDILRVLAEVTRSYGGSKAMLQFLQQNFENLFQTYEEKPDIWRFLVRSATSTFTTKEGLEMVLHLYRGRRHQLGSARSVVLESLDQVSDNVRWTSENAPVIEHWLNNYFYLQEVKRAKL